MEALLPFGFGLAVLLFVLGVLVLSVWGLSLFFAKAGGWSSLAALYATDRQPEGPVYRSQTVELGGLVRYRRSLTVSTSAEGLYLALPTWFYAKHPPLLIPWEAVVRVEKGWLYWGKAARLVIGEPKVGTLGLPMSLFERVRPYLRVDTAALG